MTFDVAGCLDQGRASVSRTQNYVAACHTLGYQHPDLTAHAAQVVEWYGAEDGMDLVALDADCARLRAAASAAEEALRLQRDAGAALAAAWAGESALEAADFVQRHCASATVLVSTLRTAADGCAALRDTLWRLVGDKAHAAVAIDDRRAEVRAAWLSAAQTVMSGAADRTEAADVVAQQITPYVDADIRTDWVVAMRDTTTSVAAAYVDAVHGLTDVAPASFDIPGQLGPPAPRAPSPAVPVPAVAPPAVTVPAAAAVEPPAASAPPPALAPVDPATMAVPPPVPQTPLAEPAGIGGAAPASLPSAGLPAAGDLGGGLSGLAGQIADALGGLFNDQSDPADAPPTTDPVADPQPDDAQPAADDPKDAEPEPDSVEPEDTEPPTPVEEAPAGDAPPPEPPPPPPAPPPAGPPPPPPTAEPVDEPTPCEIAADELPQVGQ